MASTQPKIRVGIVDDNRDLLNGVKKLLYFAKDIEIVATALSGSEALHAAEQHRPDVMLVDINLPDIDGISLTKNIKARLPAVQVVMMSVQPEPEILRRAMQA